MTVAGIAGTGKTLCSLLAGFQQIQQQRYDRVMYSRPLVTMGDGIGYLKGSQKQKMAPWVIPAEENLRRIFGAHNANTSMKQRISKQIEDLYRNGLFEVAPPSFIPGRTISDAYIIVDEAHNMSREQLKMWLSRVGVGSKIVFLGDPEQVMNGKGSFVTKANNGLVHAIDKLPGQVLYAHLLLREVKRSPTAELAKLL